MDKVWKPFRKQEDFLTIPDSVKEALYGGAAMGGKSDALVMLPIVRSFFQHPRFKGIIFRRTYPELEREIIRERVKAELDDTSPERRPLAGDRFP